MKSTLLLILLLAFTSLVKAQDYPTTLWSDSADTSWYDENQDEFTLSSAEELAGLAQLVEGGNTFEGKTITLGADIDLDGNLWTPIGKDVNDPFSGTFEGNDHTITNLFINVPDGDFQGFFGRGTGATLMNITINSAHILTKDTSGTLIGSLGTNGVIENCHVLNTSITASSYNVGGMIGELVTDSSISNCSSSGDVIGGNQVGGLAGTAFDKTSITQSSAKGTVSGNYLIGGLVGYCTFAFTSGRNNTVDNCFSRASVEAGTGRAGGIYGGSDGNLRLKNSYSTGTVSAPEFEGAVIGFWGSPDIVVDNCYFDTETSNLSDGVGGFAQDPVDYDIEGRPTADMKTQELVDLLNSGSDEAPWIINAEVNDGYPAFESTLGVPEHEVAANRVVVYPTAFDNHITISSKLILKSYSIYSYSGALVSQGNFDNGKTLTPGNLAAGLYIIRVNTENGAVTKKIIKK